MDHTHTLTRHKDIQAWVTDRRGVPAISRVPNRFGQVRAKLGIRFGRQQQNAPEEVSVDDGLAPVSWTAWLAELDRQGLALKVTAEKQYEFIERRELN